MEDKVLALLNRRMNQRVAPGLEYSPHWISACLAFRDQLYNPRSVLYPSCGLDASPSKAFKNITFVDAETGNEGCVDTLRKAGLKAFKQDIREYIPREEHDLLILMNPAIKTEWATRCLMQGSYILSNDYHSNASWMAKKPQDFTLIGSMDERADPKVSLDTSGLFEPVKSLDELRQISPERYEMLRKLVLHQLSFRNRSNSSNLSLENYFAYCDLLRKDKELPFKRKAGLYIFKKK